MVTMTILTTLVSWMVIYFDLGQYRYRQIQSDDVDNVDGYLLKFRALQMMEHGQPLWESRLHIPPRVSHTRLNHRAGMGTLATSFQVPLERIPSYFPCTSLSDHSSYSQTSSKSGDFLKERGPLHQGPVISPRMRYGEGLQTFGARFVPWIHGKILAQSVLKSFWKYS